MIYARSHHRVAAARVLAAAIIAHRGTAAAFRAGTIGEVAMDDATVALGRAVQAFEAETRNVADSRCDAPVDGQPCGDCSGCDHEALVGSRAFRNFAVVPYRPMRTGLEFAAANYSFNTYVRRRAA